MQKKKTKQARPRPPAASSIPECVGRYVVGEVLGQGGFGTVVTATHKHYPDHRFALKMERTEADDGTINRHPQLFYEYRMYKRLSQRAASSRRGCFPAVYEFLRQSGLNVLVMQEVGASVSKIFSSHSKSFSDAHIVSVGVQMLDCLRAIHECGVLHRDIKPDNFCVGTGPNEDRLYVVDFGLSKCYLDRSGDHIPHRTGKSLTGTPRYASLRCHQGHEQSRRDDVESTVFVLLYLALGRLPWQGLRRKRKRRREAGRRYQRGDDPIMDMKAELEPELLCKGLHPNYAALLRHARGLEFTEAPNYGLLRSLLIGVDRASAP